MKKKCYQIIQYLFWSGLILTILFSYHTESWGKNDFPQKNIRIIVPFSPGGSTDIQIRGLAPYLQKELGVSIVVDNRPGAMGAIGYNKAFAAKPDGYTLCVLNIPAPQLLEYLQKTKFKMRDFTHIAAVFKINIALFVNADTWKNFDEFMQAARQQKLKMGMTAKAGLSYLSGRIFEESVKIDITWVPYAGGSQSLAALAGKHIDAVLTFPISARLLVNAGNIKPIIMLGDDPYPGHPDVITADKSGFNIDTYSGYFGLVGPPGISANIANTLEAAVMKAVKNQNFIKWAQKMSLDEILKPLTSEVFKKETERQYKIVEKYQKYLKE